MTDSYIDPEHAEVVRGKVAAKFSKQDAEFLCDILGILPDQKPLHSGPRT